MKYNQVPGFRLFGVVEDVGGKMKEVVKCEIHGSNEACMICCHLIYDKGLDYARILVRPGDDDIETAMCTDCETLLLNEQAWSEVLSEFSQWEIFCRECYELTLSNHSLTAEGYME